VISVLFISLSKDASAASLHNGTYRLMREREHLVIIESMEEGNGEIREAVYAEHL
jgi:hypothetical protein